MTRAPSRNSGSSRVASSRVHNVWMPGPSSPGIGGRAGLRSGGEQEPVEAEAAPVGQVELARRGVHTLDAGAELRRRAQARVVVHLANEHAVVREPPAQVVRQQHAGVGRTRLGRDERDRRRLITLAEAVERAQGGCAVADDGHLHGWSASALVRRARDPHGRRGAQWIHAHGSVDATKSPMSRSAATAT